MRARRRKKLVLIAAAAVLALAVGPMTGGASSQTSAVGD